MLLSALAVGGHVSLMGASLLTGRGITVGAISGSRTDFKSMNRAIALHRLRPVSNGHRGVTACGPVAGRSPRASAKSRTNDPSPDRAHCSQ